MHGDCSIKVYLNQKHPGCKKRSGQELKKGLDKKEVKSKWASVTADQNKILIITSQATKHVPDLRVLCFAA